MFVFFSLIVCQVIKEVIEQQTGLLADLWQQEQKEADRMAAKNRSDNYKIIEINTMYLMFSIVSE